VGGVFSRIVESARGPAQDLRFVRLEGELQHALRFYRVGKNWSTRPDTRYGVCFVSGHYC